MSAISNKSKEHIVAAFTSPDVANEVLSLLDKADRLVRQMEALLKKLDDSNDLAETDFESSVKSVK